MPLRLTEKEHSRIQGIAPRLRSRKQLYRAEALLALAEGRPIEEVARRHRVGVERVERWVEGIEAQGLRFLEEPESSLPGRRSASREADDAGQGDS
jgi:hypothetical protein